MFESSPLLIIKQAIKDCEQHALATYHKGTKAQFNLSAAFSIAKVVKLPNLVETANQAWKTNGKFDPKKFNHLDMSPSDPDGIRRGPNGKVITGMSLHLALAFRMAAQKLNSSNGTHGERAMLAVAEYVRDQSAQGNFEFPDPVISHGRLFDREYFFDLLHAYESQDTCDGPSGSGRE